MKKTQGIMQFGAVASLITLLAAPSLAMVKNGSKIAHEEGPVVSASELNERHADRAALDSQTNAIRRLQTLLKKHRGTPKEALLLFKLGEAQRNAGSMQFRIAHGTPEKKAASARLVTYKRYLVQSAATFGELIRRFPGSADLPRAYYLRAKAQEESGNPTGATVDYLHLVRHYPKSEDVVSAYMSLGELATNRNEWASAADYFHAVEKDPEAPHYPHALYKLAWCHYNLKDVPRALSYLERDIRYYSDRTQSRSSRSDEALRENALQDTTLFFLEGFEQKLSRFSVDDAYVYFKRLDSGPQLGRMIVRYAKLLRAHGHGPELAQWKTLILKREPRRPESFDLIVIAYEDQLNKRQYTELVRTARELVAHRGPGNTPESLARAEKLLLDAAGQLQVLISRNKETDGVSTLTAALTGLYDSFTRMVSEQDPRIPKVHYNLAESLFEIREFDQATDHYRWIVEHANGTRARKSGISIQNASLRAIASRYESLRKRGIVPGNLKARDLRTAEARPLDPLLATWIAWIDEFQSSSKSADVKEAENFHFEATRCIYAHGDLQLALKRLRDFALRHPSSKYATPSATLLVDTYVASAQWEELHALSSELLSIKEWKGTEFAKRLYAVASDADFKAVETAYRAGDYKGTLGKARKFLAEYPESRRKDDCLAIAGHAALSSKDRSTALDYFDRLIRSAPGTEAGASAVLAHGAIREEEHEFVAAARDYQRYLAHPPAMAKANENQRATLRKKALAFNWISGEYSQLRSALKDANVCTPALFEECERYRVLALFDSRKRGPEFTAKAFSRARRGAPELRALWAALALEGARHLAFRDRHVAIRILARHWNDLDSLARSSVLASVNASIPHALELNRRGIRAVAPLMAREAHLVRRMEAIREIENAGMDAAKLPWARIRATVTHQLAELYAETAKSLTSLRGAGPAVAEPFNKKAEALRSKAFQLASSSSIEPEAFDQIAQPYLHADPKRRAALLPKEPMAKAQALDASHLSSLNPDGDWSQDDSKCADPAKCVKNEWYRAARQKRWAEATYLVQYAKEKKLFGPDTISLLRAYTLAGMGAQAEGLAELAEARDGMPERTRRNVNRLLLDHYQNSLARERAGKLLEEMRSKGESLAQTDTHGTGG